MKQIIMPNLFVRYESEYEDWKNVTNLSNLLYSRK